MLPTAAKHFDRAVTSFLFPLLNFCCFHLFERCDGDVVQPYPHVSISI